MGSQDSTLGEERQQQGTPKRYNRKEMGSTMILPFLLVFTLYLFKPTTSHSCWPPCPPKPNCRNAPKPWDCKSGQVTTHPIPCNCCKECAKDEGEECGGLDDSHGQCADYLQREGSNAVRAGVCRRKRRPKSTLEMCVENCRREACMSDDNTKVGCNQMFNCPQGCKMRDLGVPERKCKRKCKRNGQSGCSPVVKGFEFSLCRDCNRAGCPRWPEVDERKAGCSYYSYYWLSATNDKYCNICIT